MGLLGIAKHKNYQLQDFQKKNIPHQGIQKKLLGEEYPF